MNYVLLQMDLFSRLLMTDIDVWDKYKNAYSNLSIAIDTGVNITTISRSILFQAGYDVIKWFPSSKTCSRCGAIKHELALSDRVYICECGNILDRDENSALYIRI